MSKYTLGLSIFGIVVFLTGAAILMLESPLIALGVFLCIWGNNIGQIKP